MTTRDVWIGGLGQSELVMAANNADALDGTMFISDNLPFLRSLDDESIDLVCIDPPFGKRQTFVGNLSPPLTSDERRIERDLLAQWEVYDDSTAYEKGLEYPDQEGTTAKFRDIWSFAHFTYEDWWQELRSVCPAAYELIRATRRIHSDRIASYLAFMTERMLEIRRVMKPTATVYLHCDHEANAYLRQMMDAVFGHGNFRNEITWCYAGGGVPAKDYPRKHDTIFRYTKTDDYIFNVAYREYGEHNTTGRRATDLGGTRGVDYNPKGTPINDWWDDIKPLINWNSEWVGYPTQKPQALARRIIESSSNLGDMVLDCFAGCSYVPVAAQLAGRRWIACDMSPRAWTVVRRQFHKHPDLGILTEGEMAQDDPQHEKIEQKLEHGGRVIKVRGPDDLPSRNTHEQLRPPDLAPLPAIRFKQRAIETDREIWEAFVERYGARCWYCGTQTRRHRRELHLDHIEPNRRDGTNDDCWNRALACAVCNGNKANRLTPEATVQRAFEDGLIETEALRDEALSSFKAKHEWARLRW